MSQRAEPLSITITEITDFAYGDDFQNNASTGNFKGAPRENYKELIGTLSNANVANYLQIPKIKKVPQIHRRVGSRLVENENTPIAEIENTKLEPVAKQQ